MNGHCRLRGKLASWRSIGKKQRFAQEAMTVADHEVDLAFAAGLRNATEHPVPLTPVAKQLYSHVSQAEATVKADEQPDRSIEEAIAGRPPLTATIASTANRLIHAQHEYDQDELDDAKEDLMRSGIDPLTRIQRQFNRHEDAEHAYDATHAQTPHQHYEVVTWPAI